VEGNLRMKTDWKYISDRAKKPRSLEPPRRVVEEEGNFT